MSSSYIHSPKQFKCKYSGCIFAEGSKHFFEKYQYLKQHYDKVHAEKIFSCPLCSKSFGTTTLIKSHLKGCGKEFKCSCGALYKSNEALLMHAKRKQHALGPIPRTTKKNSEPEPSGSDSKPQILKIVSGNTCVVVIPHLKKTSTQASATEDNKQSETTLHVMAAVALSELASTNSNAELLRNKKDDSTQTESSPDEWLNLESENLNTNTKIHNSGTQTDEVLLTTTTYPSCQQGPHSPWLGLCAETQTAEEEELRPFNLCDIQTQTPWSELEDESTEFTHSETQTLLSSLFIEPSSLQNSSERGKFLLKQNSEDAATDPMEDF